MEDKARKAKELANSHFNAAQERYYAARDEYMDMVRQEPPRKKALLEKDQNMTDADRVLDLETCSPEEGGPGAPRL